MASPSISASIRWQERPEFRVLGLAVIVRSPLTSLRTGRSQPVSLCRGVPTSIPPTDCIKSHDRCSANVLHATRAKAMETRVNLLMTCPGDTVERNADESRKIALEVKNHLPSDPRGATKGRYFVFSMQQSRPKTRFPPHALRGRYQMSPLFMKSKRKPSGC